MKKTKNFLKISGAVLAATILMVNLSVSKQKETGTSTFNYKIKNLSLLQASAAEWSCDHKTSSCCTYPGMNSDGVLSYSY